MLHNLINFFFLKLVFSLHAHLFGFIFLFYLLNFFEPSQYCKEHFASDMLFEKKEVCDRILWVGVGVPATQVGGDNISVSNPFDDHAASSRAPRPGKIPSMFLLLPFTLFLFFNFKSLKFLLYLFIYFYFHVCIYFLFLMFVLNYYQFFSDVLLSINGACLCVFCELVLSFF